MGIKGLKGDTGPSGPRGDAGDRGPRGMIGVYTAIYSVLMKYLVTACMYSYKFSFIPSVIKLWN